jgi:serine/threonine protein kinase
MQRVIAFLALFSASLLQQCGSVEVTLGQPILRDKFENPQNQIVDRGSRVNLTCGPLVNDFAAQVWSYVNDRNEPLFISTSIAELGYELERINVPGFGVRTNLIISSVDDKHETFYQCVAIVNSTTRYYSAGAQLIIFEPADVRFHKDTPLPDGIFTAAPGASAVLGIEVSGKPAPQLTLLKESSGTSTTVTDPRFSVNASEIRISTVKMEDGGKYRLVVNNSRAEGRSVALQFEIYVEGVKTTPTGEPVESTDPPLDIVPIAVGVGVAVGLLVLVVLVVVVVIVVCVVRRRSRSKGSFTPEVDVIEKATPAYMNTQLSSCSEVSLKGSPFSKPKGISPKNRYGYDPSWEVQRDQVQLRNILHESQVVIIYKGTIQMDDEKKYSSVAVKTIKDGGSENDFEDLMQEMILMSKLLTHPNVLELSGIVNDGVQKMMITPCMSHGDMVGFLRSTRSIPNMFSVQPSSEGHSPHITSQDMLKISLQISKGMEYLHNQQVVHKALCGRNVLVGSNMQVKVCNYGMRNPEKYHPQKYYKWVAPETFVDRVFDKKNDSWAFGVVLWEVVTLGGCPYPNKDMNAVIHQLKSGIRLPHPSHVSHEIYSVMLQCWDKESCNRPSFAETTRDLQELWESQRVYIDLAKYNTPEYCEFDDHQSISAI